MLLAVVVVIILAAGIAVQSPKVQTLALDTLKEKYLADGGADISFSKIHLRGLNTLVVRDLAIVDKDPQYPTEKAMRSHGWETFEPYDTLMRADLLVATFSLKGFREKEGLHLRKVYINGGRINLVVEQQGRLVNLQRMFGMVKGDGEYREKTGNVFDLDKAVIRNFIYSMQIIREKHPAMRKYGIEWNDLYIYDIDADGSKLAMKDGVFTGTLDKCSFKEKSGYSAKLVSADVRVGRKVANVDNIRIIDDLCDIYAPYYHMSFNKPGDFRGFTSNVWIDGKADGKSRLNSRSLAYFIQGMRNMDLDFSGDGEIHGYVNNFDLDELKIATTDGCFTGTVDGNVKGMARGGTLRLGLRLKDVSTTTSGLACFLSDVSGKKVSFGEKVPDVRMNINAGARGTLDDLDVDADVRTPEGGATTDLRIRNLNVKDEQLLLDGHLGTEDLDLGRLLGKKILGQCSLSSALHATLRGEDGAELKIDTLNISRLGIKGYDYKRILATGSVSRDKFNGRIISQDPNFNFLFQGILTFSPKTQNAMYQFYANVGHADLHAMNLTRREESTMSLRTNANFNRTGTGTLLGNIDILGVRLNNGQERHNIGDINISSRSRDEEYNATMTSSFARAAYSGSQNLGHFISDLITLTAGRELPSLISRNDTSWSGETYHLDFDCINTSDLTAFLKPGLYIDNNTSLTLDITSDGIIDADINSRRIAVKEKYLKGIEGHFDNDEEILSGAITCEDINLGAIRLENNSLVLLADNDNVGIGFTCDGGPDTESSGEFVARGNISRGSDGKPAFHIDLLPSSFDFETEQWSIMPSEVDIASGDISVKEMQFTSGDQEIDIDGGLSKTHTDTLNVLLNRFDMRLANSFLKKQELDIRGNATGEALITSAPGAKKGFIVNFLCDSTSVAGTHLGTLAAKTRWDDAFNRFEIEAQGGPEGNFDISGTYTPSMRSVDLDANLKSFDISLAKPLMKGVFSDMAGSVSGVISVEGQLDDLHLSSADACLEDALLEIDYTKVPYWANGPFHITDDGVWFDDIALRDRYKGSGTVGGSIGWNHFKDIALSTVISMKDMELINIPQKDNDGFYGNLFGDGTVELSGPLKQLAIVVDADTHGGGEFHIPTSNVGKNTSKNLLTFKEPERHVEIDPYEEMMNSLNTTKRKGNDLSVKVRARATPDVQAFLEVDQTSGSGLSGRGSGIIDVDVRPSRGGVSLKGDYTLSSGTFDFVALGLAKKSFTISDGSGIHFNGAIMDSDLSIDAIYKTKTSISTLISDTTSVNTRRLVECGIGISDKLSNPSLAFSINVPDLEPSIKSKVENALSTEDKVQKQFLSLLLSNSFLPDEQSGIVNSSTMLYSSVSEIMSNQLNNIFQKLDIPVDLGLNYQQNERGNDIFDVAVSTQLFNNRVVINGNIGNRQYTTSAGNSDVVGDVDIEIKLDRKGAVRLTVFSHSADGYTNYLDNTQRNGLGIAYQQEFNSIGEMFKYMFAGKKKKEILDQQEAERVRQAGEKTIRIE